MSNNIFKYKNYIPGDIRVRLFIADHRPKSCLTFLNNFISLVILLCNDRFPCAYFSRTSKNPEIMLIYLSIIFASKNTLKKKQVSSVFC